MKKILLLLLAFLVAAPFAHAQTTDRVLVENSNLETDADGDQWPDGWPKLKAGGSWEVEDGNHFLRLSSTEPDSMVMLYHEINIPAGVQAIDVSFRQRITGLKVGKQAWFDARILMEFMNAAREKVSPGPKVPYSRKDTPGWEQKSVSFVVPEGATILKFMPSLFNVAAGTWDIDDIVIRSIDPTPVKAEADAAAAAHAEKLAQSTEKRRAKAADALKQYGSLIANGDFESPNKENDYPNLWGRPSSNVSWLEEGSNHFLRIVSTVPDKLVMLYRTYDIPAGVPALEMTWRQRVTGLKKGKMPWFDARFVFDFMDASGKKISPPPGPSYTQRDTTGWVDRSTRFLVPEEAVTLVIMP